VLLHALINYLLIDRLDMGVSGVALTDLNLLLTLHCFLAILGVLIHQRERGVELAAGHSSHRGRGRDELAAAHSDLEEVMENGGTVRLATVKTSDFTDDHS
jgi:hypothetical protein